MSYEFTKLSEVPAVSEFPEGANAIIETNGEIKRCPSSGGSSVPKPLTYDYMPEGYPTKTVQTTTLIDYPEVPFELATSGTSYYVILPNPFEIVAGKTYTVNWDGIEYECIGVALSQNIYIIGNLSIKGAGDDTGEPFLYEYGSAKPRGRFHTLDTSATHTISVKTTEEIVTPMAEEFLPNIPADKLPAGGVTTLHINVTAVNTEAMEATFTADKTPLEMQQAAVNGPTWCVVSFAAGVMAEEAQSFGVPPALFGNKPTFGQTVWLTHENNNNKVSFAVSMGTSDTWNIDLLALLQPK